MFFGPGVPFVVKPHSNSDLGLFKLVRFTVALRTWTLTHIPIFIYV